MCSLFYYLENYNLKGVKTLYDKNVKLQKILAKSNIGISRRKAEELIASGVVSINGKVAKIGDRADINKDTIKINNNIISIEEKYYVAMYKPRGVLSSAKDDRGRKCVTDLASDINKRLYPVGRLDKNSEGLILLTNDGEFANKIMHPNFKLSKTYRVTVAEKISEEQITKLKSSMVIDGKQTIPAQVELINCEEKRSVMLITIYQGINRQIRKMCENTNLTVKRLKRVKIGNLSLKMLKPGEYRNLTEKEIRALMKGR